MSRVLGIELRRSAAPGAAVLLFAAGTLLLFFATEGNGFATGWIHLAMTQRLFLAVVWPLAMAAGAWQGSRESRSKVAELFGSTPRPAAQRSVPTLAAMAAGVIGAYLATTVAGALWIFSIVDYLPVAFAAVTAVGALSLVAAVWLGAAIGRMLPSLVTAPALAIAGLALLLMIPWATRPHGWLALLFSPIYEMNMPDPYATVPGVVSAAQAVWLTALAAAAVLLVASNGWRLRVAALLPAVLGATLAIAVMPHQNRIVNDAVDATAKALVCTDDTFVCVSRVHSGLLPEVAEHAREGLTALAKLPGGPARVHENTTTFSPDVFPAWRTDVSLLDVAVGMDGHLAFPSGVTGEIVAGAFASRPDCYDTAGLEERYAAAYWLLGREPVRAGLYGEEYLSDAVASWNRLRKLPEAQARARVVALRQAALDCTVGDGLFAEGAP